MSGYKPVPVPVNNNPYNVPDWRRNQSSYMPAINPSLPDWDAKTGSWMNKGITSSQDILDDPSFGYDFGEMSNWANNNPTDLTRQLSGTDKWFGTKGHKGWAWSGMDALMGGFQLGLGRRQLKQQERQNELMRQAFNQQNQQNVQSAMFALENAANRNAARRGLNVGTPEHAQYVGEQLAKYGVEHKDIG